MKLLLVIAMMLLASNVFAGDNKTVVIVEKDTEVGIEQMSFELKDNKIEAASNSNFLTKSFPFHFGTYELAATPEMALQIYDAAKAVKNNKKEIFLSKHEMTVYVNGKKIPANSAQFGAALAAIKMIFESKNLKLTDGITIQKTEDIKKITCDEKKDKICIFKYGYLRE